MLCPIMLYARAVCMRQTFALYVPSAQEHGVKPKVQGQGVVAQSTAASSSSTPHRTQQQQQQQRVTAPSAAAAVAAPQPAPPASQRLQSATEFNPFTAVIGAYVGLAQQKHFGLSIARP